MEIVNFLDSLEGRVVTVWRKDPVFSPTEDDERPRSDQRSDNGEIPRVSIDVIDAVALPRSERLFRLGTERECRTGGSCDRHPLIDNIATGVSVGMLSLAELIQKSKR